MSTDDPIVRPNLMHLGGTGGGRGMGHGGMGHGGGGCGCAGRVEGAGHGEGKAEGGCGCGGGGRASRDYVVIEPITIAHTAIDPNAQKVTQPEVVA